MKKILLAAGLWLGVIGAVGAEPFSFGVKGGLSMTGQTGIFDGENPDVIFNLNGGLFADLALNDFLFFQPEMNFAMNGVGVSIKNVYATGPSGPELLGTVNESGSTTLDYLEFPLLLQGRTDLAPDLKGSLLLGPSIGILLSAGGHYSSAGYFTGSGNYSIPNGSTVELGAVAGAELEHNHWLLDLRYDLGLTSVYSNSLNTIENRVLSLDVGYRIQ